MQRNQISPDFLKTLGQSVLDFGFMEYAIRTVIITLSREHKLSKALVPSTNGVSENLDLLRRLCHLRIHPEALDNWLNAIEEIQNLFVERNRIFHGIFFEHDDNLFLAKVRKGKRGAADEWVQNKFDADFVREILERLSERRRQLFDFIDDYSLSEDGPPHLPSQDKYPSLTIKGTSI